MKFMIVLYFKVHQGTFVQICFWSAVLQVTSLTAALDVMSYGTFNKLNCKTHEGEQVSMSLIQVWYVRCETFGFEIILLELYSLSSVVIHLLHFVYLFICHHHSFRVARLWLATHIVFVAAIITSTYVILRIFPYSYCFWAAWPWRWGHSDPLKHWNLFSEQHSITSKKTCIFITFIVGKGTVHQMFSI